MTVLLGNLITVLGIAIMCGIQLMLIFARANTRAQDEAAINARLAEFVGKYRRMEEGQSASL